MPPDRFLEDTAADEAPSVDQTQQLIEAESGRGSQGIARRWQASDSSRLVLTSDSAGVKISDNNGVAPPTHVIVDGSAAGGNLSGTYPNPSLSAAIIDALVPPGLIMAWAATSPAFPAGWLPCNGSTVARASFPKLFAAIGTTWNTGGEAGTDFRLPNLQGRVLLGSGGAYPFAQMAGQASVPGPAHTHVGSHAHGLNGHTHPSPQHQHQVNAHEHGLNAHEHTLSSHTHGQNGHSHATDINHDHALASGVAVASGAITGVHEGPSAVVNVSASGHAHDVNLPALGTSSVASGPPSNPDTQGPSAANTSGNSGNTTTLAANNTQLNAVADTTGPSTPNTALDSTAPAADYAGATVATLPPYAVASYVIRVGSPP